MIKRGHCEAVAPYTHATAYEIVGSQIRIVLSQVGLGCFENVGATQCRSIRYLGQSRARYHTCELHGDRGSLRTNAAHKKPQQDR